MNMKRTKITLAQSASARLPIEVSHPDKVFWPEEGYTKLDLVEYYHAIFLKLSPYVKNRMLSLERCPDGMRGECFFQKQKPKGMPPGTPTRRIAHAANTRSTDYVVGGSLITQLSLANLGCIAVHVMASRTTSPGCWTGYVLILIPSPDNLAMPLVQDCMSKQRWTL